MDGMRNAAAFLGRLLLAALFAAGAAQKLADPGAVEALLGARGWPAWLVWPAAAFNVAGAASLATGWRLRPMAAALAAYCAITSLFHLIPDDPWQMSIFVKNWAIAGGLLVVAAQGGGTWRIGRMRPGGRRRRR